MLSIQEFVHMQLLFCSHFISNHKISKVSEKKISMTENEC